MRRLLVVASVLLLSTRALAADVDDLVLLKNGGRVRGVVVEEDPASGVRVKLPDGTVRVLRAADVAEVRYGEKLPAPAVAPATPPAPVAPPAAPSARRGGVHVESASPGMVSVDGGEVGPAPADVGGLTPGRHVVAIRFATGDVHEDAVFIQAGKTLPWSFAAPLPSDVKPFQLELAAFVGYGDNLSSEDNPFGTSFGGRVGVLAYRFYFGLDLTHTTGGTVLDGQTSSTISTNAVGIRAGYDIHLTDGFVSVAIRPFLGVESVWVNESFDNNDTASEQTWHFAPGVLGSVGIGPLAFVGVESRLSVGATPNALSFYAMGGVRLF